MIITSIKTEKILPKQISLIELLDKNIKKFPEKSLLVITSKIVALCEGRTLSRESIVDEDLLSKEADYYLPKKESRYGISLTIKDNAFIARAGIDGSNTGNTYSLLPRDSYRTSRKIRTYLCTRFGIKNAGVIIVDSHSTPLRRGTTGVAIGWSGFRGIKQYENTPDIFGKHFTTHANHVDALASAAVLTMGEGNEQTPLALIQQIDCVEFHPTSPTKKELIFFKPSFEDDLFAPLFSFKKLKKGK